MRTKHLGIRYSAHVSDAYTLRARADSNWSESASEGFKLIAERHEVLRGGDDYAPEGAPQPPEKDFDARLPSRLRKIPTLYRMTDREFVIRKTSFMQNVDMELSSAFFEVK